MSQHSSRAIDRAAPIVAILAIAIMAAVSLKSLWPPTAPGGGPASFSAERAMAHVEALAAGPRPAGSAAHRAAREYIVTALREGAGLVAEVRAATATSTRYGLPYDAARVHNVVATIQGTDPSRRIVLTAHYDTVLTSPGAGDDAAGVATLLEAGRALAVEYGGGPNVTLLFTDAEEVGAVGAEAFLASGGLDPARTTVLNFDARGTGGPCALIETAGDEGRLVRTLARSGAPVAAASLAPTLARLHGVGTDFRPFREAGASGLNFAIIDGVARYHTPADAPPALDRESVRRQGEAAVRLVRALGDGTDDGSGAASYFTAPWAGLVVYPRLLDLIAATLATVLVAFWVVTSVRRGDSSWAGLGASGLIAVAAVTLAAVACHAGWWLVRALGAGPAPGLAEPYDPVPYRLAVVLLAAGTALGVARAARLIGVTAPTGLLPLIGVAVLWGLALGLPGAAYLLAVPLPFVALHAVASGGGRSRAVARALGAAAASLPVVLVWAPVPYGLLTGLRLSAAWAAGAVAAFAVLLCASVFERARFAVDGRVAAALVALAAVAAGVGVWRAGASPETPRPVSVAYALDADAGRAFWVSDRKSAGGPEDTIFADALPIEALPRFLGEDGTLARAAAADTLAVPGPEVALVGEAAVDGRRELTVRVRSRRGAPWLHVFVEAGKVIGAAVDGIAFEKRAGGADAAEGAVWGFRHIGAGDAGFELKLVVDPAAGPLRITVVDQSPGIENPAVARLGPDAMYARSWVAGTTLARRSYAF
ncbi:MAG TPA: M28 family peptidase [Pyrinomonadaceae bacterium]